MSSTSTLRRDALRLPALFLCIGTAAASTTALHVDVPVIVSGAGWAAPAAFLVAAAGILWLRDSVGPVAIEEAS
jgi:hypothetical protein